MRGQNLRLALKDNSVGAVKKYIAGAVSFDLDFQSDTEDTSTKDVTGSFKQFEATLKSWSGSGQCRLAKDAQDTAAVQGWDIFDLVGETLEASFDETSGNLNRETVTPRKKGNVIITGWKVSAQNGSVVNVDFSFQGTGPLVSAPTISGAATLTATTTNQTSNYSASDGSAISAAVDAADTWLTATIANGVLTYKGSANAGAERTGHVTLTTTSGAELRVAITQAGAA